MVKKKGVGVTKLTCQQVSSFGGFFFFSVLTVTLEHQSLLLKSLIKSLLISDDETPVDIDVSKN